MAEDHNTDDDEAPKKKSKLPIIIGAVVLLLALGGAGYYFLVMKPAAEAKAAEEAAADDEDAPKAKDKDSDTAKSADKSADKAGDKASDKSKKKKKKKKNKSDKVEPPAYLALDPFTVNLADTDIDHYLQATIVLQVPGEQASEELKKHSAMIRDRILKLPSSSKAMDLRSVEGKQKLAQDIIDQIASAATDDEIEVPDIDRVFFTAFIIQ